MKNDTMKNETQTSCFRSIDDRDLSRVQGGYKVLNVLGAAVDGALAGAATGTTWKGKLFGAATGAIAKGGLEFAKEVNDHAKYQKPSASTSVWSPDTFGWGI